MRPCSRRRSWRVVLLFALVAACSRTPAPVSPPVEEEEEALPDWNGPPIWAESPMVKIRPDTAPRSQRELYLFAARNEFVSFQVAFHGAQTGLGVQRVSLPSLEGPSLIAGKDILLYRQTFLDITRTTFPETKPGLWPDGLIPDVDEFTGEPRAAFPFVVPPGEARAVWVDVHVPEDALPGSYRGLAQVTTQAGETVAVRIHLQVVEALIPSTPSLKTAFFIAPHYVCRAYVGKLECRGDVLLHLLPLFHRLALEHRITLAGGFPRLSGQSALDLHDWQSFDALWGPFLDGTVFSRLPGARMTSWQYRGPRTDEGLAEFVQESQLRGWLPRAFDYVGDEPPYIHTFEEVRENATLARQAAPQLRTLLTSNIDVLQSQNLEELIDTIVVLVNHMDRKIASIPGDQRPFYESFLSRPNRELWLYQSCESHGCIGIIPPDHELGLGWPSYMIDRAATKARAMEWVSFLEGASGELYYQTVERIDTAWKDQYRFYGNGDGTLFYPGMPSTIGGETDVPVPSLRLKFIRLGLQDYEWLKAVSDAGDPDYARRVARRVIPSAWRVPDDGALFESARLCLIRRYLELAVDSRTLRRFPSRTVPCPEDFVAPPGG